MASIVEHVLVFLGVTAQAQEKEPQTKHHKILIVGGGSGGIAVAAQLKNDKRLSSEDKDIAIVEPKKEHYYQPLWTMVGAGIFSKEESKRSEASVIPKGTKWIEDAVTEFVPDKNLIVTAQGKSITYDYMVVATGVELQWDKIKGLKEAMGREGVCTNYSYDTVDKTWEFLKKFQGGTMLFTFPDTPVKCGGAPQKIMWLADDFLRKKGVRHCTNIAYTLPGTAMFAVKKYSDVLEKTAAERNVNVWYKYSLIEVRGDKKEAVFKTENGDKVVKYDFLHVTPAMGAPAVVQKSPLAASNGFVDVNKHTLQHNKYQNVFSLGDVANLPTSKTIAAITQQAPTLVSNLISTMKHQPLQARYNGYTSCPIVMGANKLILAEFLYDNIPHETFGTFVNQAVPRRSMYFMKKHIFPRAYWSLFLKGRWYGPSTFWPPKADQVGPGTGDNLNKA